MVNRSVLEPDFHIFERTGKIYFELRSGQWILASSSLDGHSLDGLDDSTVCSNDRCQWCVSRAGQQARADADTIFLPTARELLDMLAAQYGLETLTRAELRELEELRELRHHFETLRKAMVTATTGMFGVLEQLSQTAHDVLETVIGEAHGR